MKTLQQEYQLIKEGKGNKDHFLKVARNMFPEYIAHGNDFNEDFIQLASHLFTTILSLLGVENHKTCFFVEVVSSIGFCVK